MFSDHRYKETAQAALRFHPWMIFLPGVSGNVALGSLLVRELVVRLWGLLGGTDYAPRISVGTFACFPRQNSPGAWLCHQKQCLLSCDTLTGRTSQCACRRKEEPNDDAVLFRLPRDVVYSDAVLCGSSHSVVENLQLLHGRAAFLHAT